MTPQGIKQLIEDARKHGTVRLILLNGKPSTAVFIAKKAFPDHEYDISAQEMGTLKTIKKAETTYDYEDACAGLGLISKER